MKDFILYPEAFELKQLGFDEPCFAYFKKDTNSLCWHSNSVEPYNHNDINRYGDLSAPTYSQAFRWFREKFNMPSKIEATFEHETPNQYHYFYQIVTDDFVSGDGVMLNWTYEEAELACLKKLIEIVKTNEIS